MFYIRCYMIVCHRGCLICRKESIPESVKKTLGNNWSWWQISYNVFGLGEVAETKSKIELQMFNTPQKMIEEQMLNNSTPAAILPMQCYVQPFWGHSDLEIYNESNLDTMGRMPDNCIDLTVTSPPYDGLRNYNGYSFPFEEIAKELYRVTKDGGVVVWVVNDSTKNGSESLTSFRQALFFKEIGFNVYDTMIYAKNNYIPLTHNRYEQQFEYMFVFSKGKPKTFNPLMKENKQVGQIKGGSFRQKMDEKGKRHKDIGVSEFSIKPNIWFYNVGMANSTKDKIAFNHSAIFPEQLANDHILSWSNEGDVVYEPFAGSGTTGKMAFLNKRKCIMSEISLEYCELSKQRLLPYTSNIGLFA
jgi:DNA modification methylase